jgi:hypothetical protein
MFVFVVYIVMQANKYFHLFVILGGTHEMIFPCLNPCLQVIYIFKFLCHVHMKCNFFSSKDNNNFVDFISGLGY